MRENNVVLNSPEAIEMERRYTKILLHLKDEFKEADLDGNGFLSKEEFQDFLVRKAPNPQQEDIEKYEMIVTEVFRMMDFDASGTI